MTNDDRLVSDSFPRASAYYPDWVLAGVSGGANPLWLIEWLAEALDLRPGIARAALSTCACQTNQFPISFWASLRRHTRSSLKVTNQDLTLLCAITYLGQKPA